MNKIKLMALAICLMLLAGCGGESAGKKDGAVTLRLAAAASLEKVFVQKLLPMYAAGRPHVKIEGVYDGSGRLQLQLEQGMAADIFIPASGRQMDALESKGLVQSRTDLLHGRLVLIVPAENSSIAGLEDITKAAHAAVGDPASVPAGRYARRALAKLGLWDKISGSVSLGGSVTEVLQWVASGSADAGIVYATDAARTEGVKIAAAVPEELLDEPIVYPLGIMKNAGMKEAENFAAFLCGAEAAAVFKEYGFEPVKAEERKK